MKILLWIIFIAGHIFVDRLITKDGGKPNYLAYFLIRGIVAILHGALFLDPDLEYWNFSSWELLKLWVPILAFQVSSFWVLYEFGRNIWSNQKALYYDSKEGDSGYIDRFFKWAGNDVHFAAKVIAILVMIITGIRIT